MATREEFDQAYYALAREAMNAEHGAFEALMKRASVPRMVSTADELNSLGMGSVVLDDAQLAWQAHVSTKIGHLIWWSADANDDNGRFSGGLLEINDSKPFEVLHRTIWPDLAA